jgi:hypothetical protein
MSDDIEFVTRCDYCYRTISLERARVAYTPDYTLLDGRVVCLPSVHCSESCAERAVLTRAGGVRG